ncbi:MAG: amidase [Legionella sp.]|nr:MAG: amidase [Legionella sp.]
MGKLCSLSGKTIVELVKKREVSCAEVMQDHLAQVAKVNPLINAMIQHLSPEEALKQAHFADKQISQSKELGTLHGLPVTIKDAREVRGFLCTYGNQSPLNFVAKKDSTVAARLRNAGAIITGITNIPDFSMSYETDNSLYGRTRNPYDLNRSPGGSSGGEAALIAACGSYLGIGADSGGSIRQPAHNCGITGLKPTLGLIPDTGVFPHNGSYGIFKDILTQGPMARYVEDLIQILPIISGPDGVDPNTKPIAVRNPAEVDLSQLRIVTYTANGIVAPRQDIAEVVNKASYLLKSEVRSVEEQYPKISKETYSMFEELFFYGGDGGQWLIDQMHHMQVTTVEKPFQAILDRAALCHFSVTELRRRLVLVEEFKYTMSAFMEEYDVIICPAATTPANLYEQKMELTEGFDLAYDLTYNLPYNITGWPAVVVRCGTSDEGLPIGVQVIAKAWRDDIALAVAKRLEELMGGWLAPTKAMEGILY